MEDPIAGPFVKNSNDLTVGFLVVARGKIGDVESGSLREAFEERLVTGPTACGEYFIDE